MYRSACVCVCAYTHILTLRLSLSLSLTHTHTHTCTFMYTHTHTHTHTHVRSCTNTALLPSPLIGTLGDIVHALCCNEDASSFITKLTLRRSDRNDFTKKVENLLKESLKCSYFENTGCTNCSVPAVQENNGSLLVCSVFSRITGEVVSQVSRTFHVQMSEEDKLEEASQYGISWRHKLAG